MGNEICKITTLLINARHKLNGLMFECQEYNATIKIIAHPHTPYITAVYRLSPTQLTVVWSPASSGSPSTSFSVSISAEGANASLMNTTIVGADGKSQEYSYTFTRLARGTTYTVSVVAINCAGNSDPVNYTGVTALECQDETIYSNGMLAVYGQTNLIVITPPDAPNITAMYRLSPTQLTVVWSPASSGGPSTSFSVSIGVNTSVMSTAIVGADNRTKEYSYTFTTLIEGTTYTVSVVAINCAGNSSPVNHTGVTVPPDAPNIIAVYSLSPTQLTAVWSPASTGSFPTSFSVSISANASLMSTAIVGADGRSHTFLGLVGGTTYTVSVVAINYAGNSSPVNQTGVTDLVCSSILQKDDIIMIAATNGGAVLVLITISMLCICICFYCKHRKQKPDYVDDTNRPLDDEVQPLIPDGSNEIAPKLLTPPDRPPESHSPSKDHLLHPTPIQPDSPPGCYDQIQLRDLMNGVAAVIPTKWKYVGIQLKLSTRTLDEIQDQNAGKPESSKLSFTEVFKQWERLQTSPYTWENMISVLRSPAVGEEHLANVLSAAMTSNS